MILLLVFMLVFFMTKGLSLTDQQFYFVAESEKCLPDSHVTSYISVVKTSGFNCGVHCARQGDCGHAMFCKNSKMCYLADDTGEDYTGDDFDQCACFASWTNVAFQGHCDASSEHPAGAPCEKAFDGNEATEWVTNNQGIGAWIRISLDRPRLLVGARVMQRITLRERNKDIRFEFSDGSVQELPYHDQDGRFWDDLDLRDVKTSWVKVTILSVYTRANNGFAEIQFFGPFIETPLD